MFTANRNGFLEIGLLVKRKKSKNHTKGCVGLLERLQVDNNRNSKACRIRYLQGRVF
jgi:hypothetical protein